MDKNILNKASANAAEAMGFYGKQHEAAEETNFNKVLEAMMHAKTNRQVIKGHMIISNDDRLV